MKKNLSEAKLAFIGCGVMGESIIAGLLRKGLVDPQNISASHPREERRNELTEKYRISVFAKNADAADFLEGSGNSAAIICVKPQRIDHVLNDLKNSFEPEQLVISIVAGATIKKFTEKLDNARIVRAMPNTPSQIGAGITAWTCGKDIGETEREHIQQLFSALGKELFVETENMIDMATSLSATGPTYVFMVMEALTDAGVHLGFSRDMSKDLVQEMMLGSVKFAIESNKHPAELRNMVTSPGGTSAEAIYQMEKGTLRTVLSKAVHAAYRRASELGKKH